MPDTDVEYVIPTDEEIIAIDYLLDVREKLGHPKQIDSPSGWKLVDAIFQIWTAMCEEEVLELKDAIKEELKYERPIRESIKKGGHFMISYPARLYSLFKVLIPEQKLNDKNFIKGMLSRYPDLAGTNYKI